MIRPGNSRRAHMRRRHFLGALGAAVAAPALLVRSAHAQKAAPRTIGFLSPTSLEGNVDNLTALRQGLKDEGFVEGENLTIVYRFAEGRNDRLPALAADMARQRVSVIATHASGNFAVKAATKSIPVTFVTAEDPVRTGLVASLARPGGNLTGVNFVSAELVGKRVELLHQMVPSAKRIGILVNPTYALRTESAVQDAKAAAATLGLDIQVFESATSRDINAAFAAMARERIEALMVSNDPYFSSRRVQLVQLSARHAIPVAYAGRWYPEIGGLMSYGAETRSAFRLVGVYTGRILKGAKPGELPVVQTDKIELVINAETARMLGIAVPASMLTSADEIIE